LEKSLEIAINEALIPVIEIEITTGIVNVIVIMIEIETGKADVMATMPEIVAWTETTIENLANTGVEEITIEIGIAATTIVIANTDVAIATGTGVTEIAINEVLIQATGSGIMIEIEMRIEIAIMIGTTITTEIEIGTIDVMDTTIANTANMEVDGITIASTSVIATMIVIAIGVMEIAIGNTGIEITKLVVAKTNGAVRIITILEIYRLICLEVNTSNETNK